MRIALLPIIATCLFGFSACADEDEFRQPDVLSYGASVAATEEALHGDCTGIVTRPIDPPFAPEVRREQLQIDCSGFPFMGAGRWTEFVFRDGSLEMAWIMVEAEDRERIIDAMTASYGQPTHHNADYVAFTNERVAWRNEPPEVLFYSSAFAEWVENWFE